MSVIEGTVRGRNSSLRRLPILLLLSIPAAAATAWDEVLLAGPIISLVETLGFIAGLFAFAMVWACLGLAFLALGDLLWPRIRPALSRAIIRLGGVASRYRRRIQALPRQAVTGAVALCLTAGSSTYAVWLAQPTWALLQKHQVGVGAGLLVIVLVLCLAVVLDLMRQRVESWVKRIARVGGPVLRPLAALLTMVYLGPVLGWPLFRLLGYEGCTTYVLTLLAAPIFAGIWVPYYGLGVWGLLQGGLP